MTVKNYLREGEKSLARRQPDRARQAFQRAADFSHNSPEVLLSIGSLYYNAGFKAEALPWFDRVDHMPLDGLNRFQLAEIYMGMKNRPKACEEYAQASTVDPRNGTLLNNYAYYCMVEPNRDLDKAIPLLERALTLAGRRAYIVDSLGWAYYQRYGKTNHSGDLQQAIDLLSEAVRKDPQNGDERLHLGLAYEAAKNWDAAYVELNKAVLLSPELSEAQAALARVNGKRRPGTK